MHEHPGQLATQLQVNSSGFLQIAQDFCRTCQPKANYNACPFYSPTLSTSLIRSLVVILVEFTGIKLLTTVVDLLQGVSTSSQQFDRRIECCTSVTKLTAGNLSMNQVRPELVGQAGSIQSRRPYPQFTNVVLNSPNLGHSSYHAFLWRAEKRYQQGFQFLFNYTFSKFIDNVDALSDFGGTPGAGYQDYYNRGLDKAVSPLDITHNATFNVIYDLPFGPGRNWLTSGAASQIVGGWQLSFLTSLLSGPVYGVTTQQNTTEASSAGPQRANILREPTLPSAQRGPEKWFDTEAFAQPARFLFGNAARSIGRAPGTRNFDIGIMKNFSFRERFRIQFRAEMFNAFNNVNFGIPGTAFGSPQFGVINTAASARVTQLGLKIYF